MRINLGDRVKDPITGFSGVAVTRTEWLHGCFRVSVQPEKLDKDGKPPDNATFDEPQLVVLKANRVAAGARVDGGPMPSTPQKKGPVKR